MDTRPSATYDAAQIQALHQKLDQILALLQAQAQPQAQPKVKSAKSVPQTDDQWLDSLCKDAAYDHVPDVRKEYAKAERWHDTNGRQLTRRSFINWLNKIPLPCNASNVQLVVKPSLPPVMTKVTPVRPPGEAPPKEVAEKLSRLLGREMSF